MPKGGSVSEAVEETLLLRPQLLTALSLGIVNYSALARLLKAEVERRLGDEVSEAAVKVAVIRLREKLERVTASENIMQVIADSTSTLIDDVGLITVRMDNPIRLLNLLSGLSARILQITQGLRTLTIVADTSTLEHVITKVGRANIEEVYLDQAAVVVESPKSIISTPGVMAYMTLILAFHGINLTQVISTYTDTLFILQRDRAVEAYSLLRTAIEEARKSLKKL